MLFLLLLLIALTNAKHDIKLSTTAMTMEVGDVKTFQVEINNVSLDFPNNAFLITWLQDDLIKAIPNNISIELNDNRTKYVYNIKLKALNTGKSSVFTSIKSPEASLNRSESTFLVVKIYKSELMASFSNIIGWCYFTAWSFSFYPQIYVNYRKKSVVGLSFDFLMFNLYGFGMYLVFNAGVCFAPIIKEQYAERHPTSPIPVHINDLIFSGLTVFVTLITIVQCMLYQRDNQKVSVKATILVANYLTATAVFIALAFYGVLLWLDVLYLFSYLELLVTITKYMPQVRLNYRRKTTEGWSIGGVVLDFLGGSLSILQMLLNAYNYGDWSILIENPTKFGLGIVCMSYDLIFIFQHSVLYNNKAKKIKINKKVIQKAFDNMTFEITEGKKIKMDTSGDAVQKDHGGIVELLQCTDSEGAARLSEMRVELQDGVLIETFPRVEATGKDAAVLEVTDIAL